MNQLCVAHASKQYNEASAVPLPWQMMQQNDCFQLNHAAGGKWTNQDADKHTDTDTHVLWATTNTTTWNSSCTIVCQRQRLHCQSYIANHYKSHHTITTLWANRLCYIVIKVLTKRTISNVNIWKFNKRLSWNVFKLPLSLSGDVIVFTGLFSHFGC